MRSYTGQEVKYFVMEKKGYTKREENAMGYLFKNKMLGKKSPHFFYNQKLNKN